MTLDDGPAEGERQRDDGESSCDWNEIRGELDAEDPDVRREAQGILRELLGRVRERKALRSFGLSLSRGRGAA